MRTVYAEQNGPDMLFTLRENVSVTQSKIWKMYIWTMEIIVRICPSILFIVLNSLVIKRFLQLNAQNRQFHAATDKFRANNTPDTSLLSRNRGYKYVLIIFEIFFLYFNIKLRISHHIPSNLTYKIILFVERNNIWRY